MNRLRELRLKKSLSLRKLSEKLNMSYSNIAMIERGERNMTNDNLLIFCDFFGVSADYLLGLTDNPNVNNTNKLGIDSVIENELHDLDNDSKEDLLTYIKFLKAKGEL